MTFRMPYFVLWKWKSPTYRTPFTAKHVNDAAWMLQNQGVPLDHIVCVTDDSEGVRCRTYRLWTDLGNLQNLSGAQLPSCYRRLKLFDPATLTEMGIPLGERVVSIDLDVVILQKFLQLFDRDEPFVGWKVPGVRHRVVINGSMWMFTAGELAWMWQEFDPDKSRHLANTAGYMGSDQSYLSHRLVALPTTGGWTAAEHGVLSYVRDVIRHRLLPRHTRVVFFPGKHKPWLPEVRKVSSWILRYVPPASEEKAA